MNKMDYASAPPNKHHPYKPTANVNQNLNQMTGSDSQYMQQARQSGLNTAASRGLINSSIAAGASQQSAIKAAAPIAQADATIQHGQWSKNQDTDLTKWTTGQNIEQDQWKTRQNIEQDQWKTQQNIKQDQWKTQQNIGQDQWKTEKSVQANLQGAYTSAINKVLNTYSVNMNEIEVAKGLKPAEKDKMLKQGLARRDADMAFLKKMFSAMPTWSNNWSTFPTMPDAPGVVLPTTDKT